MRCSKTTWRSVTSIQTAKCYLPKEDFEASSKHHLAENLRPLDLWSNVRYFRIDDRFWSPSWIPSAILQLDTWSIMKPLSR